jgi:CRISPR-associated endoribonuclease Cas6
MRISGDLILKKPEFPLDYHPVILSLLKTGLSDYMGGRYFEELYDGSAKAKPLCFAVKLPYGVKFEKDRIIFPDGANKVHVTFSTGDMRTSILLANSLKRCKRISRPLVDGNAMVLSRLYIVPEVYMKTTRLLIQMLSPICVRTYNGNKIHYTSVAREDFENQLRKQLARKFANNDKITKSMIHEFHFLPVKMKKTVVLHFGQKIECSVGIAAINGAPELLWELYENGLGSRCSNGFGLFQILQQEY